MTCRRTGRLTLVPLLAAMALALTAAPAAAQGWCQDWMVDNNDTSSNCESDSDIYRFFGNDVIEWSGSPFYVLNVGNELVIYSIAGTGANNPVVADGSYFNVPNQGDSDYDLVSFTMCDDCQYGAANFKLGLVVFKLVNSNGQPSFGVFRRWPEATNADGSFVFKSLGNVYLIASGLPDGCANGTAGVYQVSESGSTIDLNRVGCVTGPNGTSTEVLGGASVVAGSVQYLWLADSYNSIHIYRVDNFGSTVNLVLVGPSQSIRANMGRGRGLDIDHEAHLAVTAGAPVQGVRLWDITNPANPQLRWSNDSLTVHRAAIAAPLMWAGEQGSVYGTHTWNIANPTSPVELDTNDGGFWNPANSWNSHLCERDRDAVFHPDGHRLYVSRYTVDQVYDVSDCVGETAPTASLTLIVPGGQAAAFPGDVVTLRNSSPVGYQRSAIWVTSTSSPHGTIVAGSDQLAGTTPSQRLLTIPVNLLRGVGYWAHVAVETNAYPYDPGGSTPQQIDSRAIAIDRTPEATITYSAPPVLNIPVDLVAVAEGHPGTPLGGAAYTWTVTDPAAHQTEITSVDGSEPFTFDQRGDWRVELAVQYRHETAVGDPGQLYVATDSHDPLAVSSVAAWFEIQPAAPTNYQPIVLNNLSHAVPGATLVLDWSVLTADGLTVVDPLSFCDGPGTVTSDCTIPAATLDPGTYRFELVLTNTATNPDDLSQFVLTQAILTSSVQLDFHATPADPDIGQIVTFNVDGVSDLDSASWNFGGAGCSPFTSPVVCTPGIGTDCTFQGYSYASAGTKTVTLSVVADGVTYGPVSHPITVNNIGVCGGTCSYSIDPVSAVAAPAGASGSVTLSTGPTCPWSALSNSPAWLSVVSPPSASGTGPATIGWAAAQNATPVQRTGQITIAGLPFVVQQGSDCTVAPPVPAVVMVPSPAMQGQTVSFVGTVLADAPGGETVDEWHWTVSYDGSEVVRANQQSFNFGFVRPGLYDVKLEAANCAGSGADTKVLVVRPTTEQSYTAAPGHADHTTPRSLLAVDGRLLVGTEGAPSGGGLFSRSPAGTWSVITSDGFGAAANTAVSALADFGGYVYAGTRNESGGAELWRSVNGTSWSRTMTGGFGNPLNVEITALSVHAGALNAVLESAAGAEVWRTVNGVDWVVANTPGFGTSANAVPGALTGFAGRVYATVSNQTSCEVWRRIGGTSWQQVGGDGFGDSANAAAPAMAEHDGALFVGTHNESGGCELWRTADGAIWSQVSGAGFGNPAGNDRVAALVAGAGMLYAGTHNLADGGEVWASVDGVTWYPWVTGGFGDEDNRAAATAAVLGDGLYVATENPLGFQVWRMDLPLALIFEDDYERGDTSAWPIAAP